MKKEDLSNKLTFSKASVTELNKTMLRSVVGGGSDDMMYDDYTTDGTMTCTGCFCGDVTTILTSQLEA